MNFNIFNDRNVDNNFSNKNSELINSFLDELRNLLKKFMAGGKDMNEKANNLSVAHDKNEDDKVLEEYNLYEKRKIYLDNKSRRGNDLAWMLDDTTVCISEEGDGGPYGIEELNLVLPKNAKAGEVYENVNGKYVYNDEITKAVNAIEN